MVRIGLLDRGFVRGRRHSKHVADLGKAVLSGGAGEQAVMPDAVEAAWQNVDQETANELVGEKSHDLLPVGDGAAVILIAEGDLLAVEPDDAAVRDGNPVGVAREIGKHRLGPAKGDLA